MKNMGQEILGISSVSSVSSVVKGFYGTLKVRRAFGNAFGPEERLLRNPETSPGFRKRIQAWRTVGVKSSWKSVATPPAGDPHRTLIQV